MTAIRNLVIGCDGTWNDADDLANGTNVQRLLMACAGRDQVTHYEEGVGTAFGERFAGGLWGEGLDRQILAAYRFLRKRFQDDGQTPATNRIFIFGFSRGAYAARRLAGFISACGITRRPADDTPAWQAYLHRDQGKIDRMKADGCFIAVDIAFLGVWDTVKSTNDPDLDDERLPARVRAGCHAMALDEKRRAFPVLKWQADPRIDQTWFCGVHSDVGGGYAQRALSDITLRWMIDKAWEHGLRFNAQAVRALTADALGPIHDSCTGFWRTLGEAPRVLAPSDNIHASVRQRTTALAAYRPANLGEAAHRLV
jgi:uncharacterized protein (DUF2235 family)